MFCQALAYVSSFHLASSLWLKLLKSVESSALKGEVWQMMWKSFGFLQGRYEYRNQKDKPFVRSYRLDLYHIWLFLLIKPQAMMIKQKNECTKLKGWVILKKVSEGRLPRRNPFYSRANHLFFMLWELPVNSTSHVPCLWAFWADLKSQ